MAFTISSMESYLSDHDYSDSSYICGFYAILSVCQGTLGRETMDTVTDTYMRERIFDIVDEYLSGSLRIDYPLGFHYALYNLCWSNFMLLNERLSCLGPDMFCSMNDLYRSILEYSLYTDIRLVSSDVIICSVYDSIRLRLTEFKVSTMYEMSCYYKFSMSDEPRVEEFVVAHGIPYSMILSDSSRLLLDILFEEASSEDASE